MSEKSILPTKSDFPLQSLANAAEARRISGNIEMWLRIARDAMAESTIKSYSQDWALFCQWCESYRKTAGEPICTLPAQVETILLFINDLLGKRSPASIRGYLSTISLLHDVAGVQNPVSHVLVKAAKKTIGRGLRGERLKAYQKSQAIVQQFEEEKERNLPESKRKISQDMLPVVGVDICHHNLAGQQRQAAPFTDKELEELRDALPVYSIQSIEGLPEKKAKNIKRKNAIALKRARDRALIHIAHDALLRVSELRLISVEDISWHPDGSAVLKVGQRKDSREGEISHRYIRKKTVLEIKKWLSISCIKGGAIFVRLSKGGALLHNSEGIRTGLSRQAIFDIYKEIAAALALKPVEFSCHSTRIGAVHDLIENNFNLPAIQQAGGWKTDRMPARYASKLLAKKGAMAQLDKQCD